jgi:hypothetical protein
MKTAKTVNERIIKDAIWKAAMELDKFDNLNFEVMEILKNWMKAYGHIEENGLFDVEEPFFLDTIEGEVEIYYNTNR